MRTEGVPLRRGSCVRKKLRSPQGVDSPAAPGARGRLRYRHLRLCRDEQPFPHRFARASRPCTGLERCLPIELEKSLSLLDGTGRELRAESRGAIPGRLSPILDRLGLNGECWLETVRHFGRWFKRAAGGRESLAAAAMRCGRRWFQGQCAAKIAFQ